MGWSATARRARDESRPLGQRVNALHSLLANHHAPLGFQASRRKLRRDARLLWPRRWTSPGLLAALESLEESRESHLRYVKAFAVRRRQEKAQGRRQPTAGDVAALSRAEWLRDESEAA